MSVLLSPQSRLLGLVTGSTFLWTIESLVPLYSYEKHRLRRALPDTAFTVLLILTNRYWFSLKERRRRWLIRDQGWSAATTLGVTDKKEPKTL